MKTYPSIGVQIPQVLLPRKDIALTQWSVIACDQFTSQPEYWQKVEKTVHNTPSTFHLTLPEIYLEQPGLEERIQQIRANMRQYLDDGIFEPYEGLVYVERTVAGRTRRGLLLALDLECYDYHTGSSSLIRATEGTILERIPPRLRIREGAPLELPHILVLIDDPGCTVIEPIGQAREKLHKRYDFNLMLDGGHLAGYLLTDPAIEQAAIRALEALAQPEGFARKYEVGPEHSVLLFAMGDGNHSLATAKAYWEKLKPQVGMDHPARYALVEIENVHDEALVFEPIHRVLFGVKKNLQRAMFDYFRGGFYSYYSVENQAAMLAAVEQNSDPEQDAVQTIGLVDSQDYTIIELGSTGCNLPVGSLQGFLDAFLKDGGAERIDYVHGAEVACSLGAIPGNTGFYLPAMPKNDLFKTVILDGALPRKTFSMGEAREKRFYLECRKISK
jgi:hypothetical protein